MSGPTESADRLDHTRDKIMDFKSSLSRDQREQLIAILKLAEEVAAEDDRALGFEGSFTPGGGQLVLKYTQSSFDAPSWLLRMIK